MITDTTTRELIVEEARSWIGTPYRRRGAIKGVGCDCGSFPGMVLVNCGIIPKKKFYEEMKAIEALSDDWFMHSAEEKYVAILSRYALRLGDRVSYREPKIFPGNIVLMQTFNSHRRNHSGIVTQWPKIVHAVYSGVAEVDASRDAMWGNKQITVFDPTARP